VSPLSLYINFSTVVKFNCVDWKSTGPEKQDGGNTMLDFVVRRSVIQGLSGAGCRVWLTSWRPASSRRVHVDRLHRCRSLAHSSQTSRTSRLVFLHEYTATAHRTGVDSFINLLATWVLV